MDGIESSGTATLLCLFEEVKSGKKKKGEEEEEGGDRGKVVRIGMIAVMPSTGEVIYDEFDDGFTRSGQFLSFLFFPLRFYVFPPNRFRIFFLGIVR